MSAEQQPNHVNRNGQPPPPLPAELQQLEAALAALRPRGDRLDRDLLMFQMGQSSSQSNRHTTRAVATPQELHSVPGRGERGAGRTFAWLWPAATAGMTVVAASLALALVLRGEPQVVERVKIVEVERPAPTELVVEHDSRQEAIIEDTAPTHEPARTIARHWPAHREPAELSPAIPRAGLDFRLFEHLMREPTTPVSLPDTPPTSEESREVLSPRSLPNLLDQAASYLATDETQRG
jgi:hypothetical protein